MAGEPVQPESAPSAGSAAAEKQPTGSTSAGGAADSAPPTSHKAAEPASTETAPAGHASTEIPISENPAAADTPIAVAADHPAPVAGADDHDSVFGSDTDGFSATDSLTPSVLDYPVKYGRRYNAFRPGAYYAPNDEPEQERLDLTHALVTEGIGGKLHLAPIDSGRVDRILDMGTGTGIWAMDMGDKYPNAEVLGNDLSAVQPAWVPPNVVFEIDDVESEWVYRTPFDFIFCRTLASTIQDWPKLMGNVFANLRPGGFAEFQECNMEWYSEDGSLLETHSLRQWVRGLVQAANSIGREPSVGPLLVGLMTDAGFTNITQHKFKFPVGPWPQDPHLKKIGVYNQTQLLQGLEGFSYILFCDILGWKKEEVVVLLAKVREELKAQPMPFHAMYDLHVVYGQKPTA